MALWFLIIVAAIVLLFLFIYSYKKQPESIIKEISGITFEWVPIRKLPQDEVPHWLVPSIKDPFFIIVIPPNPCCQIWHTIKGTGKTTIEYFENNDPAKVFQKASQWAKELSQQ